MNYLFPAITSILSLVISLYLFRQWHSQKPRIQSSYLWATAMFVYSLSNGLTTITISDLLVYRSLSYDIIWVARIFLASLTLILMFAGVTRLVTHRRSVYLTISVLVTLFALLYPIFWLMSGRVINEIAFSYTWIFLFPFSLVLGIIFAMLYGILVAEESGKNIGALLIALSWIGYAIQLSFLPRAVAEEQLNFWFLYRIFSLLLLLIGLILLEREAKAYLQIADNDKKIHREHFR